MITCDLNTEPTLRVTQEQLQKLISEGNLKFNQPSGDSLNPVPVMGPLELVNESSSNEPPSDDEVIHAFEKSRIGMKDELQPNGKRMRARVVKEKINETIEPAKFVPLIGDAILHHTFYKCNITFTTANSLDTSTNEEATKHVLYIDHNRFKLVAN